MFWIITTIILAAVLLTISIIHGMAMYWLHRKLGYHYVPWFLLPLDLWVNRRLYFGKEK